MLIVLVNIYSIYGNEIGPEIGTRSRRYARNSDRTSKVYSSYQSYSNYVTTPTVSVSYNNFLQSTTKYNNVRYDDNYYYNNNNRNNGATNSGDGLSGYPYNATPVANTNYRDYKGNYNYETTPTSYNNYISSTYSTYNNVRHDYKNNYKNNDMQTTYNDTVIDNIPVNNSPYNQNPEYNGNYNYENNGMYNPFNNTGLNRHRFYSLTQTNNYFPGYRVNGTPVYQPGQINIPKHNTTGFFNNHYPISGYNTTGYTPTPGYGKPKIPDTYNYQDPNQNNFRGYFQQNISSTSKYGTATPGAESTPVTPGDSSDTDINVTQIACLLCNIGCPANYSRKGFHCVPNDYDYQ